MNCSCPDAPRMKCRYTVPLGDVSRYRNYYCPKCKRWLTTVELEYALYLNPAVIHKVVEAVSKAERAKQIFLKNVGKSKKA